MFTLRGRAAWPELERRCCCPEFLRSLVYHNKIEYFLNKKGTLTIFSTYERVIKKFARIKRKSTKTIDNSLKRGILTIQTVNKKNTVQERGIGNYEEKLGCTAACD